MEAKQNCRLFLRRLQDSPSSDVGYWTNGGESLESSVV